MTSLQFQLVTQDYDHLAPLASGDVVPDGFELRLERDTEGAIGVARADPPPVLGEYSLSKHLIRLSKGNRSIVGLPAFVNRSFRHRCLFVLRDSELETLSDLEGRRVGTDDWPATGNTWTRAALRERGVRIEAIRWSVGSVDGTPVSPQSALPAYVTPIEPGQTALQMLLDGEIDALMYTHPPALFYQPASPMRRLLRDFRQTEQEYYTRTGVYPIHHLIGMRRDVFEQVPWVAKNLFDVLERSKNLWFAARRRLNDTTPWLMSDIEQTTALMGTDWHSYGVAANTAAIQTLCDELYAQGLIAQPFDGADAFTEFEQL
jgi:4,5-dihydroxyphthalate decarboxylase